jgi:alpha-mannosidase
MTTSQTNDIRLYTTKRMYYSEIMNSNDNWKTRNNKVANLTKQQLIENTIDEEFLANQNSYDEVSDREIYYRAIAILNEVISYE